MRQSAALKGCHVGADQHHERQPPLSDVVAPLAVVVGIGLTANLALFAAAQAPDPGSRGMLTG